jgi:hypothetical protein
VTSIPSEFEVSIQIIAYVLVEESGTAVGLTLECYVTIDNGGGNGGGATPAPSIGGGGTPPTSAPISGGSGTTPTTGGVQSTTTLVTAGVALLSSVLM